MIDFIEYVVTELKSKRLSKSNALALVKQYAERSSSGPDPAVLHPLLHVNTSDFDAQSYRTRLTGEEHFLADHRVRMRGGEEQKVLPGVAYLEMARAAIERAQPLGMGLRVLELRDVVWSQPFVSNAVKWLSIALGREDEEWIDYEIYSEEGEEERVHCQGRAQFVESGATGRLSIEELSGRMQGGELESATVYAAFERMGLVYGVAHRGIESIRRGEGEVLARISVPGTLESTLGEYGLHPSVLDSALQAGVGLLGEWERAGEQPSLPFALESIKILGGCTQRMLAWVRYAADSQARVQKLDIDLCDEQGTLCAQLRGFTARTLKAEKAVAGRGEEGLLVARAVWEERALEVVVREGMSYAQRRVVLSGLGQVQVGRVRELVAGSECVEVSARGALAARYEAAAVACFEQVQAALKAPGAGGILLQVVLGEDEESVVLAGVSGLLKTASLENPRVVGQVIVSAASSTSEELARRLQEESVGGAALVRYVGAVRQVGGWERVWESGAAPIAFKARGVYLITGGLGGLGELFTREILAQSPSARVIVTGRGELGGERAGRLAELAQCGEVSYRRLLLEDAGEVRAVLEGVVREYGELNGILHSAGMIADEFVVKKTVGEFRRVLGPKVRGTVSLDEGSAGIDLDFLVLFSSIAAVLGNVGQADYAAGNGFMDQYARYRNARVSRQGRGGRTVSINWPLWESGGMRVAGESEELMRQRTGMRAMRTAVGMQGFYRSLAQQHSQSVVMEGEVERMYAALGASEQLAVEGAVRAAVSAVRVLEGAEEQTLTERTEEYLRREFAQLLKLPAHKIDAQAPLEQYGIDSILAMSLTHQVEKSFGPLSKTLFFEYQTLKELGQYFMRAHAEQLRVLFAAPRVGEVKAAASVERAPARAQRASRWTRAARAPAAQRAAMPAEPIAIIGLSGRYPQSLDVAAYWENLRAGRDCIVEVPKERWDWQQYFSADRSQSGQHYSKWGGFIAGVDEFDPLFFNISPREASYIDPQERLFLQHAWMAVEDAGYTRASLQIPHERDLAGQVGVYVGVMYSEYQLFGVENSMHGERMGLVGSFASVANRVSYTLNLHGPSMTLDTMCSSSLTAIHVACQDLRQGRTSLAIAGGVNVSIHPNKYLMLSAGQFISSAGQCQSFGEGGDGYIPGEGVGAVLLKRLSEAQRDGDQIYGLIRGSALNHGGRTSGATVPNPQAQASAIRRALLESNTDARHVSYIEAHGTGTKLGDPIEIAALAKVFQERSEERGFCLIGSAKSNIGHCESAAGIAGLTKVLLQMKHGQIVPSLHSSRLNPHIDFAQSPFIVNQTLTAWEAPRIEGRVLPRVAGISSFGAGGSNAHMIVEEYVAPSGESRGASVGRVIVPLSARTGEQLQQKVLELLEYLRGAGAGVELGALAYTLQVGREGMEERLGFLVSSLEQLLEKLAAYAQGERQIDDSYQGQVKRNREEISIINQDDDMKEAVDRWMARKKLSKLVEFWVKGLELDWGALYPQGCPRRISLPTYPFARERYWIEPAARAATAGARAAVLHPLLHVNTSDFDAQSYRTRLTGEEHFLADHRVRMRGGEEQKVLPGVAYLEMARAAIERAQPLGMGLRVLELRDVVWSQPFVSNAVKWLSIALGREDEEWIDYEIYSEEGEEETVHCQGRAQFVESGATGRLSIEELSGRMQGGELESATVYAAFERMGLVYGVAHRGIESIRRGEGEVLARISVPGTLESTLGEYGLHPSVLDSALQAGVGLLGEWERAGEQPSLPFALESIKILGGCTQRMLAWVRYAADSQARVQKLDIDLCDEQGTLCAQLRGFTARTLKAEKAVAGRGEEGLLVARAVWEERALEVVVREGMSYAQRRVVLSGLGQVQVGRVRELVAGSECVEVSARGALAARYEAAAVACFEQVQAALKAPGAGGILLQVVLGEDEESVVLAGVSGLLKTASLENPRVVGQVIVSAASSTSEELARRLQEESVGGAALVRYVGAVRQVGGWERVWESGAAPIAFKARGVYLITGGLGGLGELFTREILAQSPSARVIVTGRGELGGERAGRLAELAQCGEVSYRRLLLEDAGEVRAVLEGVVREYGELNGILHSAGMIADEFVVKKTVGEFRRVLGPKVRGTVSLDEGSAGIDLDFLVLFSSIAAVLGNVGQADYAAGNGFMDQYARYRNARVSRQGRGGRTVSINWPLWESGGMRVAGESEELMRQRTGMRAMRTAVGMQGFYRSLAQQHSQSVVMEGEVERMYAALGASEQLAVEGAVRAAVSAVRVLEGAEEQTLTERTEEYLRREFAQLLKLPAHKIDAQAPLEQYGIDSILAMSLTHQVEKSFGPLSKTLFFEYQTLAALAAYFVKAHRDVVIAKIGTRAEPAPSPALPAPPDRAAASRSTGRIKNRFALAKPLDRTEIAIVGLSGRYPQADNIEEFWQNLKTARDCISEIPPDRWDHTLYYDADRTKPGKAYSKWGGFIADADKFDPLFFNISPREAELMDPQERLFLQTVWETIEDAGYRKDSFAASRVGVFVGVMWGHYELFGADTLDRASAAIPTSSHASIANRVSYFFDFRGPSIALDTMCSSSLTAIHLAAEGIRRGDMDVAIAGGVNLSLHPQKYLSLSQGRFVASDGRCRSFGEGGDGYVPGEGVGAILLKPLTHALRDGDQVYAVIKSSAINHGGKTNGYSVPNPNAQAELILAAHREAKIDPTTLSYVEAHGTGTSLGDPIEITGLSKAFGELTAERQFCPIGSVKSNIGHLESAAGIAAVTKVLLQLKHRQLVPSLHAESLNPLINFKDSPFYVQTTLAAWQRRGESPRRVGVSSFGAGGSNAHLILEEYAGVDFPATAPAQPLLEACVLSARSYDRLCRYAEKLLARLQTAPDAPLRDVAHTLQVGRTPLPVRLAILSSSVAELQAKLAQWLAQQRGRGESNDPAQVEDVFSGNIEDTRRYADGVIAGEAGGAFIEQLLARRDLRKLAQLWTLGIDVDWSLLYTLVKARRLSLPTYPFARDRYWIETERKTPRAALETPSAPEKQAVFYRPQWSPAALPSAKGARAPGSILVFDVSEELCRGLRAELGRRALGTAVVWVKPGTAYAEVQPDVFTVDPAVETHFERLLEHLASSGRAPECVVHRPTPDATLETADASSAQLTLGIVALLHLCKALLRQNSAEPVKILSVYAGSARHPSPANAAVAAFLKTLHLENPRCRVKVVEFQARASERSPAFAEQAELIVDELGAVEATPQEVRYTPALEYGEGALLRQVREFKLVEIAAPPAGNIMWRRGGVYLITGGLGGLGLLLNRYLAETFAAKLVLVGRSAPGLEQEQQLQQLRARGAEVLYLQGDVGDFDSMLSIVQRAKERFGTLNGVVHSAGINRDAFVLRKSSAEMSEVLRPKVQGLVNLDHATQREALDLFVVFSSVSGAMGNVGQCDYAYANHFLDAYMEYRDGLRPAGARHGRSLSVNWPYWEHGGMTMSDGDLAASEQRAGLCALPTQRGIACLNECLGSQLTQCVALYGFKPLIERWMSRNSVDREAPQAAKVPHADEATLKTRTQSYLRSVIAAEIKLAPDGVGLRDRFESFGIDSVMISRINAQLEQDLGALPKTLIYEHETVEELTRYLLRESLPALHRLFAAVEVPVLGTASAVGTAPPLGSAPPLLEVAVDQVDASLPKRRGPGEPIAVIGVHGRYPHSPNLSELWRNLRDGKDLIDLVPADRWDVEAHYDPDPEQAANGKIYCKWGGFLEDHDKFDARFFNIQADEAKIIDPQERVFLESVWSAVEDAGYTRETLRKRFPKGKGSDVGVFVGVTTTSYQLLGSREQDRGNAVFPSALPWSIANRASYFFDFRGPSMPIDTACSSSLVAIHVACEALKNQQCQVAIAGGVNLYLHPAKYQSLCQRRMLARGAECHSYGDGDDGFVPGEGVGTLVLKPLSAALADRDHIYALIPASGSDHGGRSNGYSAPNPGSQASLIDDVLSRAKVPADSISYVEGHGTGTQMGDSLEIAALTQAFRKQSARNQYCAVGSIKANVGHSESAAGIAGVAKVILQLQHGQLAPTIHSETPNGNINFSDTPFFLQHELAPWHTVGGEPRRALVNSFGAGGVNATLILEEFRELVPEYPARPGPYLFCLSGQTAARLHDYVGLLLVWLDEHREVDLAALCHTLHVGREPMAERLAVVVSTLDEVVQLLRSWHTQTADGAGTANVYAGVASRRTAHKGGSRPDRISRQTLVDAVDWESLAKSWVAGAEFNWDEWYGTERPMRMSLPTYPFARERVWIDETRDPAVDAPPAPDLRGERADLHPLISHNSSTLREVSFTSVLSEDAFYAVDHTVNGTRMLPGAGFLEVACAAGMFAGEQKVRKIKDTVWIQPLTFHDGPRMLRTFLKQIGDSVEFAITSSDDDNEKVVHCEGRLAFESVAQDIDPAANIALGPLMDGAQQRVEGAQRYRQFAHLGLDFGPSFQTIQEMYIGSSYCLSRLKLADQLKPQFDQFILHPSLLDGALQTVAGFVRNDEADTPYLPFALDEIEIVRPVPQTCFAYVEAAAPLGHEHRDTKRFHLSLINDRGELVARLTSLYVRAFRTELMSRS